MKIENLTEEESKTFVALLEKITNAETKVENIGGLRVWTIGNLEHRIIPSSVAIERLQNVIKELALLGKDLVWGPDLTVQVIRTE